MENAVEALGYAFAVFVFVIALTVSMNAVQKARETSDSIFASIDSHTYYQNLEMTDNEKANFGRTVGVETIIPTLYRDIKENYIIEIYDDAGKLIMSFDVSKDNTERKIYSGSANIDAKQRLDILINGPVLNGGNRYVHFTDPAKPPVEVDGIINNLGYLIKDDIAFDGNSNNTAKKYISEKGLYNYLNGKKFTEEYAYVVTEKDYEQEKLLERIEKIYIRYKQQ